MPNTTSRLSLVQPVGTDAVSELRVSIAGNATSLDAAVMITEGTLASRPSGSYVGQTYYATDTGLWYFYTGSAWETVMLAGAWHDNGAYSTRLVGDTVSLKGDGNGYTLATGDLINTLSSPYVPSATRVIRIAYESASVYGVAVVTVASSGAVTWQGPSVSPGYLWFDGVSYPL